MVTSRALARRSRLRPIVAALVAAVTAATLSTTAVLSAQAADIGPGYDLPGVEDNGRTMWLGALENPNDPHWLQWCIEAGKPIPEAQATSITTLTDVSNLGQGEFTVTTPQMAWLLENKEGITTADSRAALSFLLHANYDVTGPVTVEKMIRETNRQYPSVINTVRQYIQEAKASAAVGYENLAVKGEGKREGILQNVGSLNADGRWLPEVPLKITLEGPAVFKETGTNTWTGKTADRPLAFEWAATGNGIVKAIYHTKTARKTLTKYGVDGSVQATLSYGGRPANGDPEWTEGGKAEYKVIYDFQPTAVSNVGEAKVVDGNTISDTLTASADPNYGGGEWLAPDDAPIPVTFEGKAYRTGELPADESADVPAGVEPVATTSLTFDGPGTQTATVTLPDNVEPGFITWVWSVDKNAHGDNSKYIHANWADKYGLADETTSRPYTPVIDTAITARETKSGYFFHDDVWVTGMPDNHGDWSGSHGFKADVKTLKHELFFFDDELPVTEANKAKAELMGSVDIPAKNGFYPSVGSTKFKAKDGNPAGTYVFVTSFAGDDRVKPLVTSVEDKTEQFKVEGPIPTLKTTATDKTDGDKTLAPHGTVTISDNVCYTGLKAGKEYELSGVLMDKATGKPLMADGAEVKASKVFTPSTAEGCEIVDFTLDVKHLVGKTTVVFESLTREGKQVAVHADINDEGQTIPGPGAPSLRTTATDKADGDKTLLAAKDVTVSDKVCYDNLIPGKEYTLEGVLMDKATGKPLMVGGKDVKASKTFTAKEAKGCEVVDFTLNATALAGKKTVVFEKALHEGVEVAVHADINDEGQTVEFVSPPSPPLAKTGADDLVAFLVITTIFGVMGAGFTYARLRTA